MHLKLLVTILFSLLLGACASPATPTLPPSVPPPATATSLAAEVTETPFIRTPSATTIQPTATRVPPTPTATNVPPTPSPTPIGALGTETNAAWDTFVASIEADEPAQAQARVDEFWDLLVALERVPLVLNDAAIFLYKGDASSVVWRGDFSYWQFGTGLEGKRIGNTDLWYAVANFPRDSRAEYKIVVDDGNWILDPANPNTRRGSLSDNSVLTMPDFKVTDLTARRPDVPQGTLTDWVSLNSKVLNAPVNYRLYFPPNYESVQSVPSLYVTDGNDFSDIRLGGIQNALDNLIADEKIEPLLVVFIDARNPRNPEDNQRETQFLAQSDKFAEFIVNELVKQVDATNRTRTTPDARGLAGKSFGGVFTTYAGLRYPNVFGKLAIFSPAYWVFESPDATGDPAFEAGALRMDELVDQDLATASDIPAKIFMSHGIPTWDVGSLDFMADLLRVHGDTVEVFRVQEGHSLAAWSGLTDEMLEYLFPK